MATNDKYPAGSYADPRCKCTLHDALRWWATKGCPVHDPNAKPTQDKR